MEAPGERERGRREGSVMKHSAEDEEREAARKHFWEKVGETDNRLSSANGTRKGRENGTYFSGGLETNGRVIMAVCAADTN